MNDDAWIMQTGWHPDCDISPRAAAILRAAATIYAGMLASGQDRHDRVLALEAAEWMEQECRNVGAEDGDGKA